MNGTEYMFIGEKVVKAEILNRSRKKPECGGIAMKFGLGVRDSDLHEAYLLTGKSPLPHNTGRETRCPTFASGYQLRSCSQPSRRSHPLMVSFRSAAHFPSIQQPLSLLSCREKTRTIGSTVCPRTRRGGDRDSLTEQSERSPVSDSTIAGGRTALALQRDSPVVVLPAASFTRRGKRCGVRRTRSRWPRPRLRSSARRRDGRRRGGAAPPLSDPGRRPRTAATPDRESRHRCPG